MSQLFSSNCFQLDQSERNAVAHSKVSFLSSFSFVCQLNSILSIRKSERVKGSRIDQKNKWAPSPNILPELELHPNILKSHRPPALSTRNTLFYSGNIYFFMWRSLPLCNFSILCIREYLYCFTQYMSLNEYLCISPLTLVSLQQTRSKLYVWRWFTWRNMWFLLFGMKKLAAL